MPVTLTDKISYKRLVVAGNNEIWYGGTGVSAGGMIELAAANGDIDTTDQLQMFEGYQKVFVVNGANLKVADFINTVLDLGSGNEMTTPPGKGDLLSQTGTSAKILVDFVDSTMRYIYGYVTSGTFNTTGDITQTTQADDTLDAMSPNPITATLDDVTAPTIPHWYSWAVFPTIGSKTYGTMPDKAYLGCLYRGRPVLSGNPEYPYQWYMARQANFWDFAYTANDAQSPVAGGNSDAGEIGDVVRCLIPYKDDYLIFGCATSIWVLRGDPAESGSIDEVDLTVGIYGANSWCFDGVGNLYFFGTNGIYKLPVGFGSVENLSQLYIPDLVGDEDADISTHRISMEYDRRRNGILICITKISDGTNSNYWYDLKADGFFPETYPTACGPYSLFYYDANNKDFRELLVGSTDGYIRRFDEADKDDDTGASTTEAISSYAVLPIQKLNKEDDKEGKLTSMTFELAGGLAITKLTHTALTTAHAKGDVLTQATSAATMVVHSTDTAKENTFGHTTTGTFTTAYAVTGSGSGTGFTPTAVGTGNFTDTDGLSYEFHVGDDAETVLEDIRDGATARELGTLSGTGRKNRIRKRVRGAYLGVKLYNSTKTETWALNKITGEIKPAGRIH